MIITSYDLYLLLEILQLLSFQFCSQNQLNIYRNISAEPEECLAFRLFLDKVSNMYVNLKKKIEISHLRGSVVIHKSCIYFTAIQQVVDEYYPQEI